jgi:hypothetical protein
MRQYSMKIFISAMLGLQPQEKPVRVNQPKRWHVCIYARR